MRRAWLIKDVDALARCIVRLLEDEEERQHFSSAGLRRAATFSWERTARAIRGVYEEAIQRYAKIV